ncbi:MAG TPA: hypothetical protein VE008_07120 [Burkholderiales bacterium]|nr:hypothetical protein [Burkholderiales bacterium]
MKKSRKTPARKRPTKRARSTVRSKKPTLGSNYDALSKSLGDTKFKSAQAALFFEVLKSVVPPIGEYFNSQGGIFHGLMRGQDGKPDYLLISAEKKHHHAGGTFAELQQYAKDLAIDGHNDFVMPNRKEQRVQFANAAPGQFEDAWYLSGEQYADDSDFAWCQYFGNGSQDGWHKVNRYRGCAVRRVPIR